MTQVLTITKYISKNKTENIQTTTLVFIHGWGLNSAVWESTVQYFQQYLDVITVDLPGHGLNINNTLNNYTLASVVNEIQQAIKVPAIYIGWSLGGLVATQLALSFPEKVTGCVTVASSPCFLNKTNEEPPWQGILPKVLTMFYVQLAQDTKKTIDGFLKIQAMGSPQVRQHIKTIRDLVMQHPLPTKQTLADSLTLLETVDLRENLPEISCPMLRLYGKLDSLVPKAVIEKIDHLAPCSQKHIFDKASHAPFISDVDEFNNIVHSWLIGQKKNKAND